MGTIAAGVVKALADVVHDLRRRRRHRRPPAVLDQARRRCPGSWAWPRPSRRWSPTTCARAARSGSTAASRPAATCWWRPCSGPTSTRFGTAALLAEGCIMVRTCHQDNCPVGIATQRPDLRAKFTGTPEHGRPLPRVRRRGGAASCWPSLGLRSLDEAIGRVDLLAPAPHRRRPGRRARPVAPLLATGPTTGRRPRRGSSAVRPDPAAPLRARRPALRRRLAGRLARATLVDLQYPITNADRTVGARARRGRRRSSSARGRPPAGPGSSSTGTAGQSFGAFLAHGVDLELTGDANDYVGKGMGGGRIVVRPPADDAGAPRPGRQHGAVRRDPRASCSCAGRAGERFAVRNCGATAVVEGVGDHCVRVHDRRVR